MLPHLNAMLQAQVITPHLVTYTWPACHAIHWCGMWHWKLKLPILKFHVWLNCKIGVKIKCRKPVSCGVRIIHSIRCDSYSYLSEIVWNTVLCTEWSSYRGEFILQVFVLKDPQCIFIVLFVSEKHLQTCGTELICLYVLEINVNIDMMENWPPIHIKE